MIVALIVSAPLSVALGYSFGPPVLIPILSTAVLTVDFLGKPKALLAARWTEMSPASIFAFDIVVPLGGLSILHAFMFGIGAIAGMGSDLSV